MRGDVKDAVGPGEPGQQPFDEIEGAGDLVDTAFSLSGIPRQSTQASASE